MKKKEKCVVDWCVNQEYSTGYCRPHTNHIYRYGEARRFGKKPNEILEVDDHLEIVLYDIHLKPNGYRAKIDKTNLEEVRNKRFYYSQGYAKVAKSDKTTYLHQILSKCEYPLVCDHINRDKLDCRTKNLRCVTRKENNLNK